LKKIQGFLEKFVIFGSFLIVFEIVSAGEVKRSGATFEG